MSLREFSKVPEGHHLRVTILREALRGNLPLEGSAGSLRGFCGGLSDGSAGVREIFRGFLTLENCWRIGFHMT